MRANEFIVEAKKGKISKRKQQSTVGLNKFRDVELADRLYELNRVMMAVASTDGTFVPKVDGESWSGRYNIAMAYTKAEQDMLNKAYKAVGASNIDVNKGDLRSQELPGGNPNSLVKPFKGYKRK
jgi:hypothetical protein